MFSWFTKSFRFYILETKGFIFKKVCYVRSNPFGDFQDASINSSHYCTLHPSYGRKTTFRFWAFMSLWLMSGKNQVNFHLFQHQGFWCQTDTGNPPGWLPRSSASLLCAVVLVLWMAKPWWTGAYANRLPRPLQSQPSCMLYGRQPGLRSEQCGGELTTWDTCWRCQVCLFAMFACYSFPYWNSFLLQLTYVYQQYKHFVFSLHRKERLGVVVRSHIRMGHKQVSFAW